MILTVFVCVSRFVGDLPQRAYSSFYIFNNMLQQRGVSFLLLLPMMMMMMISRKLWF